MKRMLINATHAEELRVAIVDGQKLIDIDIEVAGREQRKGNIYKAIVTRVEPSLEACFVNYGEERHGFLPFKEIDRSFFKAGVDVRNARIQDAIVEGQELVVQVEKEERGNKGAALTTMVSLAGRYLVLMPNNPRGGGVSRRIEGEERNELREAMGELDIPQGMSIIARTAGIGRSSEELQHDMDYLLRLWGAIDGAAAVALDKEGKRENPAPFLIIEESSLEIRAIRDYFSPDIGEILVDNETIAEQARGFMTHVMPHMANRVKFYTDDVPLYSRFQIEHQVETAYSRTVPLPSGGAIVIDHTEALVSIDVNSARATRGSDIEDTAFRTNCEAADEAARQLRLRDLGGLVVIDFIDMESSKNQKEVESRLKDALHYDRARVQMGKISRFGLMELSRQRLRPSLSEGSHTACPRCNGTGVIRDIESSALHILRIVQEEAMKEQTAALNVQVPVDVATYLLNEKRAEIHMLERRTKTNIILIPNKYFETPHYKLDRLRQDDERLDLVQASYEQVEKPADDVAYEKKEDANRQEPVVKGIVPAAPAPTPVVASEAVMATPVAKKGLFATIKSWFVGEAAESTVEPEAPKKSSGGNRRNPHNAQNRSNDRNGRGRNDRGGRNRNERGNRKDGEAAGKDGNKDASNKDGTESVESREARGEKGNRPPRNKRNDRKETDGENTEARADAPREPRAEGNRQPRSRGNRNARKDAESTEVSASTEGVAETAIITSAEPVVNLITGEAAAQNTAANNDVAEGEKSERRERRSRGGRDRRERRERREQREGSPTEGNPEMSIAASTVSQLVRHDDIAVDHTPITVEVSVPVASKVSPAVEPVAQATAATLAAIVQDDERSSAEPVVAHVEPAMSPVVTSTPEASSAPVAAEPTVQVKPVEQVVASVESLDTVLNQAGLQMVQTDSSTVGNFTMSAPVRNHPPRERKPRSTAADEPLQMVETQN